MCDTTSSILESDTPAASNALDFDKLLEANLKTRGKEWNTDYPIADGQENSEERYKDLYETALAAKVSALYNHPRPNLLVVVDSDLSYLPPELPTPQAYAHYHRLREEYLSLGTVNKLYFYCGTHLDPTEVLYGPIGLVRSLIAQSLYFIHGEETIPAEKTFQTILDCTFDKFCEAFESTVTMLAREFRNTPIYFVTDKLDLYLVEGNPAMQGQIESLLQLFHKMTRATDGTTACIQVFITESKQGSLERLEISHGIDFVGDIGFSTLSGK